jgi:glycosyltransferase involved in cell wall biosynthesis
MYEFDPAKIRSEQIKTFKEKSFLPENTPLVLLPGRITRWKGHDVAIKAVAELGETELVLAIAGKAEDGSNFMEELLALISKSRLERKVKFLDDIKDMAVAYAACDLVLSTSIEPETFGRISAEANAMGKPVIASDHGGSKEIIIEGKTGYLVKTGDPAELARAIKNMIELMGNSELKEKLAVVCRNNIEENFSLSKMCEKTLKVYNQFYQFNL